MSRMSRYLVSQFRHPEGTIGQVAGWVMARRPSNRARNVWTLDLLEVEPDHRILEIGFGPGYAIEQLLRRLETGRVTGLDHSSAMVRQARGRNREGVLDGRVQLRCGSVDDLGSLDGTFDRVYSSNVVQFWRDRVKVFRDILRVLAPGGRVATTYQPRHANASDHDAVAFGEAMLNEMETAGFRRTSLEQGPKTPVLTVSAIGARV